MALYENNSCPVCGKQFQPGDDIVTCPECGTPHHRACYRELGHCAHQALHGDGYAFTPADPPAEQKSSAPADDTHTAPPEQKKKCVACDAELDGDAVFCTHCGARQPGAGEKYRPPILQDTAPDPSQYPGTIEGEAAADVAAVVRTNTGYFLPRFRRNKKVGWNWAAFLFGPYYLFFRKMYKEGTAALAIRFAASLIVQGAYASQFAKLTDFMSTNYTALMQGKIQPDAALVEPLYPAVAILMSVGLAIHLVIALFANRLYRRKVFTVLQTVDDRLQDGAIFRQAPMLPEQMRLTQDEMRRMYLSKMGGTSVFAPIMAFLILDMISGLLSSIL